MNTETDKNCMSYWFPKLEAAGIPTPRTELIHVNDWTDLCSMLDGESTETSKALIDSITAAGDQFGWPIFLRTGLTSGKHQWNDTCFVHGPDYVPQHVYGLMEYSECADMLGLPYNVWAVREFLPLFHLFTAFAGMPVARERRYFVSKGAIRCSHWYWPANSIQNPSSPNWETLLDTTQNYQVHLPDWLAFRVAKLFKDDDAFSVDIAQKTDGSWIVLDMALAAQSFHWEGCPNDPLQP